MAEKRCSKCGEVKPSGADHFRPSKWADGWTAECRACLGRRDAARYAADPAKFAAYKAAWNEANRERVQARMAAYRSANREALRTRRAANYAVGYEQGARYRAANRELLVARTLAWRAANPDKAAALCARYAATKLRATPSWADAALVDAYYALARAMTEATGVPHHVDHIEPLRGKHVCGLHNEFNLQVLPARDNQTKNNRRVDIRAPACLGPAPSQAGGAAWR